MTTKEPETARHGPQDRVPAMLDRYRKEIVPVLMKQFGHKNSLAAARLEKIVLNIGCGEAAHDAKALEEAQEHLGVIAGQRPVIARAKKAISNFKIREGDPVGVKVTLRRGRMYEFMQRLVRVALPRIRDFRGLNPKGFDQSGNYSFGLREHTIFPELNADRVHYPFGMDVVLVIRANDPKEAQALLTGFGFPFAAAGQAQATGTAAAATSR